MATIRSLHGQRNASRSLRLSGESIEFHNLPPRRISFLIQFKFRFQQNKLRQLDDKQQELIRDNLELKELCLYLDEERANVAASIPTSCTNCGAPVRPPATSSTGAPLRDDGDGSSSSTNDEPMPSVRQFDRTNPVIVFDRISQFMFTSNKSLFS